MCEYGIKANIIADSDTFSNRNYRFGCLYSLYTVRASYNRYNNDILIFPFLHIVIIRIKKKELKIQKMLRQAKVKRRQNMIKIIAQSTINAANDGKTTIGSVAIALNTIHIVGTSVQQQNP